VAASSSSRVVDLLLRSCPLKTRRSPRFASFSPVGASWLPASRTGIQEHDSLVRVPRLFASSARKSAVCCAMTRKRYATADDFQEYVCRQVNLLRLPADPHSNQFVLVFSRSEVFACWDDIVTSSSVSTGLFLDLLICSYSNVTRFNRL
jgi:hypothetical protein